MSSIDMLQQKQPRQTCRAKPHVLEYREPASFDLAAWVFCEIRKGLVRMPKWRCAHSCAGNALEFPCGMGMEPGSMGFINGALDSKSIPAGLTAVCQMRKTTRFRVHNPLHALEAVLPMRMQVLRVCANFRKLSHAQPLNL